MMVETSHSLQTPGSCSISILKQIYKRGVLITYTLSELPGFMFLYSYQMYLSVGPADEAAPGIRSLSLWEEMGSVTKLKPCIQ